MNNKLIVALDVDSFTKAKKLVDRLYKYVGMFKVGSELFITCGPRIIEYIKKKRREVFLDVKLYDIPNTVAGAVRAAERHKVSMLTLHVSGGIDMLTVAKDAPKTKKRPLLIGVTVLTSEKSSIMTKSRVQHLAFIAKRAGLDGVVCSARETKLVKEVCGRSFLVVNPGVRPVWAEKNDQMRVTTPKEAIDNGADYIVIGRPIIQAKKPDEAANKIIEEIS